MTSKSIKVLMLGVIAAIIIAGVFVFLLYPRVPLPQAVSIDTSHQPTMGDANAKVEIVVFEDLKCGNCMRFATTLLPNIKKSYIDTGKAKLVVMNLAFIPGSMPAANAARCVYTQSNELFFKYIDYIYHHQPTETDDWATVPTLLQFASHVPGIQQDKLSKCLLRMPYTSIIDNNLKIATKVMKGNVGTPSVFINGVLVSPLTLKQFDQVFKAVDR